MALTRDPSASTAGLNSSLPNVGPIQPMQANLQPSNAGQKREQRAGPSLAAQAAAGAAAAMQAAAQGAPYAPAPMPSMNDRANSLSLGDLIKLFTSGA